MITFQVTSRDVDYLGNLKLSSLCGSILAAAGVSADASGFGVEDVRKLGFSWVVSALAAHQLHPILEGETIRFDTWIEKFNRLYSYRHFELFNEEGVMVGKATSTWSLIDFKERKLANILSVIEKRAMVGRGVEMSPIVRVNTIEPSESRDVLARYSDLDTNLHVNSIKYIDWVCDSITLEQATSIKRIDISYLREIRYNETAKIEWTTTDEGNILFLLKDSEGKLSCSGLLTLK